MGWSEILTKYFWVICLIILIGLTNTGKKIKIFGTGIWYLIFSSDKKFKLPSYDPGQIEQHLIDTKVTKELILIRHGESTWNEVFNRGINIKFPFRLIYALCKEFILFVTNDSCLFDSPLCDIGVKQANLIHEYLFYNNNNYMDNNINNNIYNNDDEKDNILQKNLYIQRKKYIDILKNKDGKYTNQTMIVSSCLRRCIETISLSLFTRLNESNETIYLLSQLQEMTRNVDGLSISSEKEIPALSWTMRSLENIVTKSSKNNMDWENWLWNRLELSNKNGYKSDKKRGDERMKAFFSFIFNHDYDDKKYIIVSGHSLYFKNLFRGYLPKLSNCQGKTCKISNGGIVSIKLSKLILKDGKIRYRIDNDSVLTIYKGFDPPKNKKKLF